mgnify:FL=1
MGRACRDRGEIRPVMVTIDYFGAIPTVGAVESYIEERILFDPSETIKNVGAAGYPLGINYKFPALRSIFGEVGGGVRSIRGPEAEGRETNLLMTLIDPEGFVVCDQFPVARLCLSNNNRNTFILRKGTLIDFRSSFFQIVDTIPEEYKLPLIVSFW